MAQTNTSPWAGVPYNADITAANVEPMSPWINPDPVSQPQPTMVPKVDLHKPLVSVFAPQPSPQDALAANLSGRLNADYQKDITPYGSENNHPGVFGKIAHALSHATGGDTRRQWEEQGLAKQLNDVVGQESQNAYRNAETGKTTEETSEMPGRTASEEGLQGAQTGHLNAETQAEQDRAAQGPDLATAYAHAVNDAIKRGVDPSQDPVVQHLADSITSIQKQPVQRPGTKTVQLEVNGKPHQVLIDEATGKQITDLGESGEKPPTVNVNAGLAAIDREVTRLAKPYEKGVADANTQMDKIADARAMINGNAESQALGVPKVLTALVSGAGSGVRITQPELNAIAKARGIQGDVEGTLRSWAGQGKLTPTQQQQLTGLLDSVQQRLQQKMQIHNQALDAINGAGSREEAIAADKNARKQLSDMEHGGTQPNRPANVPEGWTYQENGPKGKGWYAPAKGK